MSGFIRVNRASYTITNDFGNSSTCKTTCSCSPCKGIMKNRIQHIRNNLIINSNDDQAAKNDEDTHKRNNFCCKSSNTRDTPENNIKQECRINQGNDNHVHAERFIKDFGNRENLRSPQELRYKTNPESDSQAFSKFSMMHLSANAFFFKIGSTTIIFTFFIP